VPIAENRPKSRAAWCRVPSPDHFFFILSPPAPAGGVGEGVVRSSYLLFNIQSSILARLPLTLVREGNNSSPFKTMGSKTNVTQHSAAHRGRCLLHAGLRVLHRSAAKCGPLIFHLCPKSPTLLTLQSAGMKFPPALEIRNLFPQLLLGACRLIKDGSHLST
jgi:hypothetical protein